VKGGRVSSLSLSPSQTGSRGASKAGSSARPAANANGLGAVKMGDWWSIRPCGPIAE
jgi:hypothetical protein